MIANVMAWAIAGMAGCQQSATSNATDATAAPASSSCPAPSAEALALNARRRQVAVATSCDRVDDNKALITAKEAFASNEQQHNVQMRTLAGKSLWDITSSSTSTPSAAPSMSPTSIAQTVADWTLFEDRPGKPGWISDTGVDLKHTNANRRSVLTMTVELSRQSQTVARKDPGDPSDWLLLGLRRLLFTVGYLKTYGSGAGTFTIKYCNKSVATVDTMWSEDVSLIEQSAYELPLCPQAESTMKQRFTAQKEYATIRIEAERRVKLVSFGLCPFIIEQR